MFVQRTANHADGSQAVLSADVSRRQIAELCNVLRRALEVETLDLPAGAV